VPRFVVLFRDIIGQLLLLLLIHSDEDPEGWSKNQNLQKKSEGWFARFVVGHNKATVSVNE